MTINCRRELEIEMNRHRETGGQKDQSTERPKRKETPTLEKNDRKRLEKRDHFKDS